MKKEKNKYINIILKNLQENKRIYKKSIRRRLNKRPNNTKRIHRPVYG